MELSKLVRNIHKTSTNKNVLCVLLLANVLFLIGLVSMDMKDATPSLKSFAVEAARTTG